MSFQTKLRFGFNIMLLVAFATMAYNALEFQRLARYMPLFAASACFVLMIVLIIVDLVKYRKLGFVAADETIGTATLARTATEELEITDEALEEAATGESSVDVQERKEAKEAELRAREKAAMRRVWTIWAWILGYVAGIYLVGLMVATPAFLISYLWLQAKASWKTIIIGTVVMMVGLRVMIMALNLVLPDYLAQDWFFS